jgi:UrcA family protein
MSRLIQAAYGTALVLFLGIGCAVSHADPASSPSQRSTAVHYNDLSLDRAVDVKTLYRRIETAADRVCGPREVTGSHLPAPSYLPCYDVAVRQAVESVANPALSAYYQSLPGHASIQAPALAQR